MSPRRTPDPQELLKANTAWVKLVGRSREIAEARYQNKDADIDRILGDCGVDPADKAHYKKIIKDCPVTNPW